MPGPARPLGYAIRALCLAVVALMAWRLLSGWDRFLETGVRFRAGWFLGAVLFYLLPRLVHPLVWTGLLRSIGAPAIPYRTALDIDAKAWLGRYLPGKVFLVGAKIWLGRRLGIGTRPLAISSLVHLLLTLVQGTTAGVLLLLLADRLGQPSVPFPPLLALVAAGIVLTLPPVFRRLVSIAARILRRPPVEPDEVPSAGGLLRAASKLVVTNTLGTVHWFFLFLCLAPDSAPSIGLLLFVAGAGSIGGAAGVVAFFAPAGLGVKEATTAGLLALATAPEIGIAFALLSRVVAVLGDVLYLVVARLTARVRPT